MPPGAIRAAHYTGVFSTLLPASRIHILSLYNQTAAISIANWVFASVICSYLRAFLFARQTALDVTIVLPTPHRAAVFQSACPQYWFLRTPSSILSLKIRAAISNAHWISTVTSELCWTDKEGWTTQKKHKTVLTILGFSQPLLKLLFAANIALTRIWLFTTGVATQRVKSQMTGSTYCSIYRYLYYLALQCSQNIFASSCLT